MQNHDNYYPIKDIIKNKFKACNYNNMNDDFCHMKHSITGIVCHALLNVCPSKWLEESYEHPKKRSGMVVIVNGNIIEGAVDIPTESEKFTPNTITSCRFKDLDPEKVMSLYLCNESKNDYHFCYYLIVSCYFHRDDRIIKLTTIVSPCNLHLLVVDP